MNTRKFSAIWRDEIEKARPTFGPLLQLKHVKLLPDVVKALSHAAWDIILCDYAMPGFDAFRVMDVLEELRLDIPFIMVSGLIEEDMVEQLLKMGGNGFIRKDDL